MAILLRGGCGCRNGSGGGGADQMLAMMMTMMVMVMLVMVGAITAAVCRRWCCGRSGTRTLLMLAGRCDRGHGRDRIG